MQVLAQVERHWILTSAAAVVCAAATVTAVVVSRRPTAALREERRRLHLALHGRIVDGSLIDVQPGDAEPVALVYQYRIAGVTYECSQDVRALGDHVHDLRLDCPVQVRYNRDNPGDSIVVAESWNGLQALRGAQFVSGSHRMARTGTR